MHRMKRAFAALASTFVLATIHSARADRSVAEACADDYVQGQIGQNAHKLLEARDAFRRCARPTCKDFIVRDCSRWLDIVQASLPAVVLVAQNQAGDALSDVKVTMDGNLIVSFLDGRSVEVDPGPHVFAFETADGRKTEKSVLVPEGDKSVRVIVTIPDPVPAAPPPRLLPLTTAPVPPEPVLAESSVRAVPWKTIGLTATAVGVAGVAVGVGFGLDAVSKLRSAQCDADDHCHSDAALQTLREARRSGDIATAMLVGGGVVAVSGVLLWALAPRPSLRLTASVEGRRPSLVLSGAW